MKLVVPCVGNLTIQDARLVRLAEFLGGQCELLPLEKDETLSPEFIETRVKDKDSCFVVNPATIQKCLWSDDFLPELARYLTSRFSFVFIHGLSPDHFADNMVRTFSGGSLDSVRPLGELWLSYKIAADHKPVCGPFSGLNFGPVAQENDQVFSGTPDSHSLRTYIAIGGQSFFASIQRERAEVFFLAGAEIADLEASVRPESLTRCFSRLIPPAMFIRYAFGEQCWNPNQPHATLIIDDPLLWKNYGFLNFERVLGLMEKCNFHTSIAFKPRNWRRNETSVEKLFREHPDRYSLCFHGNDHTSAEFATKDAGLLDSLLTEAEQRMEALQNKTGIQCDHVMVFPQGYFSLNAMEGLKAHAFSGAVNSRPYPLAESSGLTLRDLVQPSILKYGGLPLFVRRYVREITMQDLGFDLFFGKPILIVEHHDIFRYAEYLTSVILRINAFVPNIIWSNLQTSLENSYLKRRTADGALEVRAYSSRGRIENRSDSLMRCSAEWPRAGDFPVETVTLAGTLSGDHNFESKDGRVFFDLAPGESRTFSVGYPTDSHRPSTNRPFRGKSWAFFRQRLSEIRDNYLCKVPALLSVVNFLQGRVHKSRIRGLTGNLEEWDPLESTCRHASLSIL